MKELFTLAAEKLRRRGRSTVFLFLVLTLSFGFILLSLSLERSMSYTNQEFRFDNYGEWYLAIPKGLESDGRWLSGQSWAEKTGRMETLGRVQTPAGEIGLGTLNQEMLQVGRLTLEQGRWPQAENEIVMESDALMELGYSAVPGQQIRLSLRVSDGLNWIELEQEYLLCGVLREYSDLWTQGTDPDQPLLVSAAISEAGAARLEAVAAEQGAALQSDLQYFIWTPQAQQKEAASALDGWLSSSARNGAPSLSCVYQNLVAYETDWNGLSSGLYSQLVTIVAVAAVLCIYLMQLPREIRSFATLRSIGMSRGQLAGMLATEALLLCLPAAVVGTGLGAAATWSALRLLVESENLRIQLAIPWAQMWVVSALWCCGILGARLFPFVLTLRMPLTGRFQLPRAQASRLQRLRRGGVLALLALFGAAVIFPCLETIAPRTQMENWTRQYSYRLRRYDQTQLNGKNDWEIRESLGQANRTLSSQLRCQVEQIPGIDRTIGVTELEIGLGFDGMEERTVPLYVLEEEAEWDEILELGEDKEAFYRGDLVLICFPTTVYNAQTGQLLPVEPENYPLPQGEIELFLRADDPLKSQLSIQNNGSFSGVLSPQNSAATQSTLFAQTTVPASSRFGVQASALFPLSQAYTLVCSQAYLIRLLDLLPENFQWQCCNTGEEIGWEFLYVMCDPYTTGLSVDLAISQLSQSSGLTVLDQRQQRAVYIQESLQMIVLLWSAGGCISLILFLILCCVFSMEAEQQRREFTVLRAIGMSRRQMKAWILGQGIRRGLAAVLGGWILYLLYDWTVRRFSLLNLWNHVQVRAEQFGLFPTSWMMGICFLLPLAMLLYVKRRLLKGRLRL